MKAQHYVLCIKNESYPASLELRKIYEVVPDQEAEAHGQIRIIDESDEDYLYPREFFLRIEIPEAAEKVFQHA